MRIYLQSTTLILHTGKYLLSSIFSFYWKIFLIRFKWNATEWRIQLIIKNGNAHKHFACWRIYVIITTVTAALFFHSTFSGLNRKFPLDSFRLSHKYLLLHSSIWHYFMLVICLRHDTLKLLFIWLFCLASHLLIRSFRVHSLAEVENGWVRFQFAAPYNNRAAWYFASVREQVYFYLKIQCVNKYTNISKSQRT